MQGDLTAPEPRTEPPVARIARLFVRLNGHGPLPSRISAPLRRMAPEHWSDHLGELLPVLVKADVPVRHLSPEDMARWASMVHMVACLAGTSGDMAHASGRRAGQVMFEARYSEARLEKLLSAHGPALRDQIARLARFLAANGGTPLDLRPLAELLLWDDRDEIRGEAARLTIARDYFAAADHANSNTEASA